MTSKSTCALIGIFILACCVTAQTQESEHKPAVAIRTFENPPYYFNSTIGTALTDLFITELMRTGRYRIVERDGIDDLIDEIELGESTYGDKESAVRKGHFIGPEYLLIAKVTNFGETERTYGAGFGGLLFGLSRLRKSEAYVRLDFRIVDAVTREVLNTGYGEGLDKTTGISLAGAGGSGSGSIDLSSRSFIDSQLGRATLTALRDLIVKMDHAIVGRRTSAVVAIKVRETEDRAEAERVAARTPGRVLAVLDDRIIIISLGRNHGIKEGDTLLVLRPESITNSKGEVVYTDEIAAGTIMVSSVTADRSKATRLSGRGLAEGYIVRRE